MQDFPQDSGAEASLRASASPFRRIYFLHGLAAGPLDGWERWLDEAASLGFDHVLISPPFRPGASGDVYRTASHDALDERLGARGDADEVLARLANACAARHLRLLLDLVCDRFACEADLVAAQPGFFAPRRDGDDVTDPRRDPGEWDSRLARLTGARDEPLLEWWRARIARWLELGIGGFRALGLDRVPAASWAALVAGAPRARWLAWTPGVPRDALHRLAGIGFDATFSSVAWWDGRQDWLIDEHDALASVAPAVAPVEAPFAARVAASSTDPQTAARRALAIAAGTGCGMMMPMGFERGARHALDRSRITAAALEREIAVAATDLRGLVAETNRLLATDDSLARDGARRALTGPDAAATAILRGDESDLRTSRRALLLLVNPDPHRAVSVPVGPWVAGFGPFAPTAVASDAGDTLRPGEARLLAAPRAGPIRTVGRGPDLRAATGASRIAIEAVAPSVDGGRFPAKRVVGEDVVVEADIFADGHDQLAANLLWHPASERAWRSVPMARLANDRWRAAFPLTRIGRHLFTVEAWRDAYATWRDDVEKKAGAGRDVGLEIEEGRALLDRTTGRLAAVDDERAGALAAIARRIADAPEDERLAL